MKNNLFKSSSPHHHHRHRISKSSTPLSASSSSLSSHHSSPSLCSTDMEQQTMGATTQIIRRWTSSLVSDYHAEDACGEVHEFINAVHDLRTMMRDLISTDTASEMLVDGQHLLQTAVEILKKEFFSVLKNNRHYLKPESLSDRLSKRSSLDCLSVTLNLCEDSDDNETSSPIGDSSLECEEERSNSIQAINDLMMIADCMISSGYGKECISVYTIMRKSAVDEALYNLGIHQSSSSSTGPIHRTKNWEAIEIKIKSWLGSVNSAVRTIFNGERILSDHVFSSSVATQELCLSAVIGDAALALFAFPKSIAGDRKLWKKSPERIFRALDLYEAIADLSPDIESIFSFNSMKSVQLEVESSLRSLGEAVRTMLTGFEFAIGNDNSKTPDRGGGGVLPLVRYVMNFLVLLSDYSASLSEIHPNRSLHASLPENYIEIDADDVAVRFAWLILVLLRKIDAISEKFRQIAHSYLFLINNLNYVVEKVRSTSLQTFLGGAWVEKHEEKVREYTEMYERAGWSDVISALSMHDLTAKMIWRSQARECFVRFNVAFEEAREREEGWVVVDEGLREKIAAAVARKVVPMYWKVYLKYGGVVLAGIGEGECVVKFAPEDLENYFSGFLSDGGSSGGGSSGCRNGAAC